MIYVFDLDGTIIDSSRRHWLLMEKLLGEAKLADGWSPRRYMEFKGEGHSGKEYLRQIMRLDDRQADDIMKEWVEHIEDEEWLIYDDLFPDVNETLPQLSSKIVLLTLRNNADGIKNELIRLNLDCYETYVVNKANQKGTILKELVEADRCAVIGDTEVDYEAGIAAGCDTYVLNRGFRSKNFWDRRGITSFGSLHSLFKSIR